MLRYLNYLVGVAMLLATGYFLRLEYQTPPVPTAHLLFHGVFVVVALVLMRFAGPLAEGLGQIGKAIAPFLPFKKPDPPAGGV